MVLRLDTMKTKELAEWFGIKYQTFRANSSKYYKLLEDYCEYDKVYGGVIIKEIYIDTYDKALNVKDDKIYYEEISKCIEKQNGLATIAGMSRLTAAKGVYNSEIIAKRHLTKAGNRLFGETKALASTGTIGSREYIWAIKLDDLNHYRLMTAEEEKLFDSIIVSCYLAEPDKVKKAGLLEDRLRKKEIDVDEYFLEQERLDLNNFRDCIFKFKEETGHMIVRCTKHQICETISFE